MSTSHASVRWQRQQASFTDNRYTRSHSWHFDGGTVVPASASPQVVPLPWSDPAGVDPEEAFVASLSSCHMLWFLSIAAQAGWLVDDYRDDASGVLARNPQRQVVMTEVTLRPAVQFGGARVPDRAEIERLHHEAHAACFIANSVKTEVRVEPVLAG
jgi:organic hydroperoxide reductase OsmC/OhrA